MLLGPRGSVTLPHDSVDGLGPPLSGEWRRVATRLGSLAMVWRMCLFLWVNKEGLEGWRTRGQAVDDGATTRVVDAGGDVRRWSHRR